jgi:TNF receptor-associated protein 1
MEHAKTNPFFEPFLDSEVPVLFLSESIDEMILTDQGKYKNFQMINIESDFEAVRKDLNLPPTKSENSIPENEISSFCLWIKVRSLTKVCFGN